MKLSTQSVRWMLGALAVTGVLMTTAAVYPQVSSAAGDTPIEQDTPTDRSDRGHIGGDKDELLAEALGITVEELEAAQDEAAAAALQQAVTEGLITQEQADQIQERGMGRFGFGRFHSDTIDPGALLADALGITVEELETAQQAAQDAALAQAVADGDITQEQADLLKARQALKSYLSNSMQAAYEDAVQQALTDGAITQEQADQLLAEAANGLGHGFGRGVPGFDGGRGGRGGHDGGRGGMPGRFPGSTPDTDTEESAPQGNSSDVIVPSSNL